MGLHAARRPRQVVEPGLFPGAVVWVDLGITVGREQSGRRPCVIISSTHLLDGADTLAIIVPCTRRDRGWPNHVELTGDTGLSSQTFVVTEQPRTVSRDRLRGTLGRADDPCLSLIMRWVRTWLA